MADERFDVVLFGPTGVTGREVARHLHRRAPAAGLRWAAAGRDRGRVEEALDRVGAVPDGVLVADAADPASIDAMAAAARVVANLVGPYARFGEPVYEACTRHGTTQLDLAGEIDWVAEMIDRHQAAAVASGARIVPTAGFEALPFDLAALLAARTASERHGGPVVEVDLALRLRGPATRGGGVSGGTFVSGVGALERGGRSFRDPFVLDPPEAAGSGPVDLLPRRHAGTGAWVGPTMPSPFIVPPVVHRSAALLRAGGDPLFSPGYRYREGLVTDDVAPGPLAPVAAGALAASQVGAGLLARAPAGVRRGVAQAMLRLGPEPGEGAPADELDAWSYRLDARATTAGGGTCDVVVEADGHPGYKSTATMVGEAALILADGSAPVPEGRGFLTPATALGVEVLDRFVAAGARFRVVG